MHAGIYARISLDRHDGEGVARQLDDCRTEAQRRGWTVTEYVDNDISATTGRHRPQWAQMLDDLHHHRLGAVIAYHPDRLYRRLTDLEHLIAAIEAAGATVVTIRAGDIDLTTATGRMTARIIGAVAAAESERTGERVARAKRSRAAQGRPAGGGRRPYGLSADRHHLVDDEAQHIRTVAANILAGASYNGEANRLNDLGATTTTGRRWDTAALRRVLTSPHVAGLRAYHGEVVAETVTPPIIDRDTWDTLRLAALGRQRPGRPATDRHLLTGLIRCAECERPMYGSTRNGRTTYRCPATVGGCSRSITAGPLDELVMAAADRILASPEWIAALAAVEPPDLRPVGEVEALELRRNAMAARWAAGEISDGEYDTAREVIAERIARLERPMRQTPMAAVAAVVPAVWRTRPVAERRQVIAAVLATPILVGAGTGPDGRVPVADRVTLRPPWEA